MSDDFAAFYEQWFGKVYNYARGRTGSASRADEIVSDTFSRAFKSWERFDAAKADRQTWLFSIAYRAIADHYRGQGSWASLDAVPDPLDDGPGPGTAAEAAGESRALAAALLKLDEQAREVVSLRFFAGMTNRAIAGLLGLSESNVAVILFRSIRRMRKNLPELEADHGRAA